MMADAKYTRDPGSGRFPNRFWDPIDPRFIPEVPHYPGVPQAPMSDPPQYDRWNRQMPRGDLPPLAGSARPDVTILRDPSLPPQAGNIDKLVEMKFPGDTPNGNQEENYPIVAAEMGAELVYLDAEVCGCEPGDEAQEKEQEELEAEKEADQQELNRILTDPDPWWAMPQWLKDHVKPLPIGVPFFPEITPIEMPLFE